MKRIALLAALAVVASGCSKKGRKVRRDRDAGVAIDTGTGGGARGQAEEKEPNNESAAANPVEPGRIVRGTLDGETDLDVYRVTVASPGQLKLSLGGIEAVDLVLELADATGAALAKSDRGPAKTNEGIPGYGVLPGDYLVTVKEFVKPKKKPKPDKKKKKAPAPAVDAGPEGRVGPSAPYELTIELVAKPEDLTEIEPDDDRATASEVLLADTVHGWIGWSGDVDLWKLSLEGVADQYAVDLDVAGVDGVTLTVEVLDAGGEKLLARAGAKGGPVQIRGLVPALGENAPPWHYVRITGDKSNPEQPYDLRFTARLREPDEEAEPNDAPERATALRPDATTPQGAMRASWADGDVDRFRVGATPEPQLLDVTLEPPSGVELALEVGAPGQPPLATASVGSGGKARLTGVAIPANADVVITVQAKGKRKQPTGEAKAYRLVWSVAPSAGDPMPPEEGQGEAPVP
jgi:hypothetical protein